jgi:hypothetical protein
MLCLPYITNLLGGIRVLVVVDAILFSAAALR